MQDELVTVLGVKISSDFMAKVAKFKQGLQQVADKMQKVATAGAVAGTALMTFAKLAGDNALKLQSLSDSTGITTEKLQELEYVANASGVSVEALNSDLASLTSSLNDPTPGKFNEGLVLLGINSRDASGKVKKADEVLMEMADRIKGMSTVKAIEWGKKAGISAETIKLLKQGKKSIQDLANEGRALGAVIPNKGVEQLAKFSKAMKSLGMIGKQLAGTFFASLAPSLNKVVDLYKRFSMQSGGLVRSGIEKFAKQIGKAFEMVATIFGKLTSGAGKVFEKFKPLTKLFEKTNIVASALTVAIGAMVGVGLFKLINVLRMINPWLIAVVILVEELYTWFTKGFESTGFFKLWQVFEKKFPRVAGVLKSVFASIKEWAGNVIDMVKAIIDTLSPLWDAFVELGKGIMSALQPVFDGLKKWFSFIWELTKTIWGGIFGILSKVQQTITGAIKALKEPISWVADKIKSFGKWLGGGSSSENEQANKVLSSPVPSEITTGALATAQGVSVPAPNNVTNNNQTSTVNNTTATGTTNVYIQAGGHDVGEVLGGVQRTYGNSLNITNAGQTGGALIQ